MKLMRLLIVACLAMLAFGQAAYAEVSLKDGALSYPADVPNKDKLDGHVQYGQVAGSDFSYAIGIDPYDGAKPVLYFFDKDGALKAKRHHADDFPFENFAVDAISMSPKGDIVAVDTGTWLVRAWVFMSFPELKQLDRDVSYLMADEGANGLVWVDNNNVIVQQIDSTADIRKADYDPQGPRSIALYSLTDGQLKIVFAGTPLCDYVLTSFDGKTVTADEICASALADWKTFEGIEKLPKKTVSKNIADLK